ncbi:IS110 family transposase [Rhizobium rhizogenes]|uniref:Transposase, IS111A/IS1328/IS1533:Transposase IS116/IS110/IS902 n=1 Tax=Rhizobium rhizogenes (strain K84 / ATCC BAA-868) TaxID=311403 RepID=B9JQE0_RHIR8|nr:Transposase, IS111A/IS1328/IS1533:Transposase IS116/IS110/IS902 [Rhizobium rhizogenes K84]
MSEVRTIGLDLAKTVFQIHGADASGAVVFRKQLRRRQVLEFFARQPHCLVTMEACGSSHFWAREIGRLGHEVRMIPPAYVKPFVKRQKNDMADAEAICEAAQRPTMHFVAVKSEEAQGVAVVLRTRDLLIRQRTQTINALRGHLAEFGEVAPEGSTYAAKLIAIVEDPQTALPQTARASLRFLTAMLSQLNDQIQALDAEIVRRAREDETARRLMTIPGVGPLIASALVASAPPPETFQRGRDFAAWLGLVPRQHSTGGKHRLGSTTKMRERSLRRLLIMGANSVVVWRARKGAAPGSWLAKMLAHKPPMLVRVALANKMARIVWALMAKGEVYRAPVTTA